MSNPDPHGFSDENNDGFAIVVTDLDSDEVIGVLTGFHSREEAEEYASERKDVISDRRKADVIPHEGV